MRDDDVRELFERAGRSSRPEFGGRLAGLLREELLDAEPTSTVERTDVLVQIDVDGALDRTVRSNDRATRGRRWYPGIWLGAAAAVATLVGFVVAPRDGVDRATPASVSGSVDEPDDAADECGAGSVLGVAPAGDVRIRVGLTVDGRAFCLFDDTTGTPLDLGATSAPGLIDIGSRPSPDVPIVVASAPVGGAAWYYVIAVPTGMPVASVEAPQGGVHSFASQVRRLMLVLDVRPKAGGGDAATDELQLYSSTGTVLAVLSADRIERPAPQEGAIEGGSG